MPFPRTDTGVFETDGMDEDSIGTTAFTLVWVLGIFVLGIPFLIVRRSSDRLAGYGGWLRLLGIPLVIVGAGLYIWATRTLTDPGGTPAPTHEPEALVTTGPYQHTRNPYYVSVLCVLLGEAALLGHIGLPAYTGVIFGYFETLVVGYEEPRLHEKYGDQYDAYRNDVPRWGIAI